MRRCFCNKFGRDGASVPSSASRLKKVASHDWHRALSNCMAFLGKQAKVCANFSKRVCVNAVLFWHFRDFEWALVLKRNLKQITSSSSSSSSASSSFYSSCPRISEGSPEFFRSIWFSPSVTRVEPFVLLVFTPRPHPTPRNGPEMEPNEAKRTETDRNRAKRSRNGPKSSFLGWDGQGVCWEGGGGWVFQREKENH